ncbi:zinc finger protein ZFP2 isoform X2 [Alexandromys fortis]|uniref:zinc finger protein ZFP2 isoform X2 n=1 Tax=Alexandromys fortis TaxID=100897 RepID=UPI0021528392|nr:zinc finger protein ZFP2 isoform X2 [Microtus fortis]XP_050014461.1 zinc finger protein ZFP2 isoform X2 [Microtus fortis]
MDPPLETAHSLGRPHRKEEGNGCLASAIGSSGLSDIQGCVCGLHLGGVDAARFCAEEPVWQTGAGEQQEPGLLAGHQLSVPDVISEPEQVLSLRKRELPGCIFLGLAHCLLASCVPGRIS